MNLNPSNVSLQQGAPSVADMQVEADTAARRGKSDEAIQATRDHPLYYDKKFIEWLEDAEHSLKLLLNKHFRGF